MPKKKVKKRKLTMHIFPERCARSLDQMEKRKLGFYLYDCGADVTNKHRCFVAAINGFFNKLVVEQHLSDSMRIAQYLHSLK